MFYVNPDTLDAMIAPLRRSIGLAVLLVVLAAICRTSAASPATSRRLITEAQSAATPEWLAPQLQREVRGRMGRFDAALLASVARARVALFEFEFFDDVSFGVEVQKVESYGRDGRFVVHGRLTEGGKRTNGTALFSVVDGVIQADLTTEDGRKFAIQHAGGELCRISEMDGSAPLGECGNHANENTPNAVAATTSSAAKNVTDATVTSAAQVDGTSRLNADAEPAVVDIMIVYTPAFQQALGGTAAVEARAQLAVSTANQIFAASEIKSRLRLVHTAKVNYIEGTDMSVDLWRLADPTDGFMDEVAQLREQHAADVVHLFGQSEFRRGQATGYPSDSYAVVLGGEPVLFTHELGHNFGCQHDRDAAGQNGSSYAFGYVFTAAEDGKKYGCVMSYTGNAGAIQRAHFSNPNLSYKGTPTGVPKGRTDSADNARMVDLTAPMLAGIRSPDGSTTRMPVFASPPRLNFPMTALGATTQRQNIRLAFAGGSRPRPLQVSDFRITGDADAFLIEIWDPTAGQFLSGPNFTIPENGITLFVRFRPTKSDTSEAAISFNIDDPAYRYMPPPIQLVGNASAPLLKNISTRVVVGEGDDALIGGFIVGGEAPREILVRAIGPSLTTRGIAGVLADPAIELYRGDELIAQNDEWVDGFPRESIKWTGIAPTRDLESAVLARLEPGSYTAVVRGHNRGTGVGLIEAYDLEARGGTQLLNISTRGHVRAGDGVMIGGFILGGASPSRVLLRALGPSLESSGVGGVLIDPSLEVFDNQGNGIAANDNWRSDNERAIAETGVAPGDDREAAALLTLTAGSYTAVVRGAGETSGVGLVEVYKLE